MYIFFLLFSLILSPLCAAQPAANSIDPLPVEQAYRLTANMQDKQTVVFEWSMPSHYYLYRDRIHFTPQSPSQLQIGQPILPTGIKKYNELLGHYIAYEHTIRVALPIIYSRSQTIDLHVSYQGCSDQGYCYPPVTQLIRINRDSSPTASVAAQALPTVSEALPTPTSIVTLNPTDRIAQMLQDKNPLLLIPIFLGLGLLLAFTPCVLPMIPIVSSIIIGAETTEKNRGTRPFFLSLCYVFGMAGTYALAGVLFGLLGSNIQTILQLPWIIALFSLLFVVMALSLFGLFELRLPHAVTNFLHRFSHKQKSDSFIGATLMGVLATLILSPCVTPPLVGVLSFISHTGNAALGGMALFFLGLGMGLPLLLLGVAGERLLPKAGMWMNSIKHVLGVLMLAVAINFWLLDSKMLGVAVD